MEDAERMGRLVDGITAMRIRMRRNAPKKIFEAIDILLSCDLPASYVVGLQGEILQMIGKERTPDPVWVYLSFFGEFDRAQFLKVGVAKDVRSRINGHRTSNPLDNPLTLAAEFECRRDAMKVEAAILSHMKPDRANGEWIHCKASIAACQSIAESLGEVASVAAARPVVFTALRI